MTEFSPPKTAITAGGSVLYQPLSESEIEQIMQYVSRRDSAEPMAVERMRELAHCWKHAAGLYEQATHKAIAILARNHVMELLCEVNRLASVVNRLPMTVDGVPVYPGMRVWFYSAKSASQFVEELEVIGWYRLSGIGDMRSINVVNERGEEDAVNLACCYSTFDAAQESRLSVAEIASRRPSEADAGTDAAARAMFTEDQLAAWEAMGRKTCGTCGVPLRPCPKGPGADEPGYVGFYPCKHDDEDPNG